MATCFWCLLLHVLLGFDENLHVIEDHAHGGRLVGLPFVFRVVFNWVLEGPFGSGLEVVTWWDSVAVVVSVGSFGKHACAGLYKAHRLSSYRALHLPCMSGVDKVLPLVVALLLLSGPDLLIVHMIGFWLVAATVSFRYDRLGRQLGGLDVIH